MADWSHLTLCPYCGKGTPADESKCMICKRRLPDKSNLEYKILTPEELEEITKGHPLLPKPLKQLEPKDLEISGLNYRHMMEALRYQKEEERNIEALVREYRQSHPVKDFFRNSRYRRILLSADLPRYMRTKAIHMLADSTSKKDIKALIQALRDPEIKNTVASVLERTNPAFIPILQKSLLSKKDQQEKLLLSQIIVKLKKKVVYRMQPSSPRAVNLQGETYPIVSDIQGSRGYFDRKMPCAILLRIKDFGKAKRLMFKSFDQRNPPTELFCRKCSFQFPGYFTMSLLNPAFDFGKLGAVCPQCGCSEGYLVYNEKFR